MGAYSMRLGVLQGCLSALVAVFVSVLMLSSCTGQPSAKASTNEGKVASDRLTITGVTLVAAPDAEAQTNTTLVIENGKIVAVFQGLSAKIEGKHLVADGLVATAGLWNCHVHLTSPNLASEPQTVLNEMVLRYGFTQIVDTGSQPADTLQLRRQIETSELAGPRIYMANGSFVGEGGSPSYLPGIQLPEVTTRAQAAPMVKSVMDLGIDGIKIFSGSFLSQEKTVYLKPAVIEAIVTATHKKGGLVVAHPTTVLGLTNAVAAGVDVIAHTTAPEVEISPDTLDLMRSQGTALVPTLKLWRYEMKKFGLPLDQADFMEQAAVAQLRLLRKADISILFGTDVGYMTDYDPQMEYQLMQSAGMSWRDILEAGTVAPAQRYGIGGGAVAVGSRADLTIYSQDPRQDVGNFAEVAHTVVRGKVVWSRQEN